jgi:hypothetical protein
MPTSSTATAERDSCARQLGAIAGRVCVRDVGERDERGEEPTLHICGRPRLVVQHAFHATVHAIVREERRHSAQCGLPHHQWSFASYSAHAAWRLYLRYICIWWGCAWVCWGTLSVTSRKGGRSRCHPRVGFGFGSARVTRALRE